MRMPLRLSLPIILLALSLVASACAPKVTSTLPPGGSLPKTLAVLPADYSIEIPRERIDLVRSAIIHELRNRNFVVIEDRVIKQVCSSPSCPHRSQIAQNYLVDGFVTVTPSSFSRNNFVAGYYNQLQGTISIADPLDRELISVSHTENESGGVLLQSGQLFQGIISQVKHSGDDVFDDLADRFARAVVEKLPPPALAPPQEQPEGLSLALTSATAEWNTPSTYTVCARGTPHSFAYLILDKVRTPLREIKPGTYCGAFSSLVTSPTQGIEAIELRTAFGNSVRTPISLPAERPCDLKDRLEIHDGSHVDLLCASVNGDSPTASKGCSNTISLCTLQKVLIYEAPELSGPYRKVSEQKSASITLPPANTIAILTVGRGGVPSKAVTVSEAK